MAKFMSWCWGQYHARSSRDDKRVDTIAMPPSDSILSTLMAKSILGEWPCENVCGQCLRGSQPYNNIPSCVSCPWVSEIF